MSYFPALFFSFGIVKQKRGKVMLHIHFSDTPIQGIEGSVGDQHVLALILTQQEGGSALAELTLMPENPSKGWCAIADDDVLIFVGQLVGISQHDGKTCKATYRAYSANPLVPHHLPYDPLFFDEPHLSQYLEASPYLFDFDRCTGVPRLSHVQKGGHHYDIEHVFKLETHTLHMPYQAVKASVEVEWVQKHEGTFDLAPSIHSMCEGGQLSTLAPESLMQSWPKEGPFLSMKKGKRNGYQVVESTLEIDKTVSDCTWLKGHIWIDWTYAQKRAETVHFTVSQTLPNAWQGSGVHSLKWRLQAVDDPYNPVLKGTEPSFWNTERGQKALEYAIKLAQNTLYMSKRCLQTKLTVPFNVLKNITMDTSLRWGKTKMEGKVAGYRFIRNGKQAYGEIIVRHMIDDSDVKPIQVGWMPISPQGMLGKPPATLVEKIEVHHQPHHQREHVEQGGSLVDVPTKILVRLAELGKPETLHEVVNLGEL